MRNTRSPQTVAPNHLDHHGLLSPSVWNSSVGPVAVVDVGLHLPAKEGAAERADREDDPFRVDALLPVVLGNSMRLCLMPYEGRALADPNPSNQRPHRAPEERRLMHGASGADNKTVPVRVLPVGLEEDPEDVASEAPVGRGPPALELAHRLLESAVVARQAATPARRWACPLAGP